MRGCWQFPLATLLHGVGTGLIGILVALLISTMQKIGFGLHSGAFLEIAAAAPAWRRMLSVTLGGLFGSVAWYWLRSRETAFVQVETSIATGKRMPVGVTLFNAFIQDTCVALGGSFGREAAPREIAAMWGGVLADAFKVTQEQRRVLVACGTGAGLAAVYSVPISGVLYTIEHVLEWEMSFKVLAPAILTSVLATAVSSMTVDTDGLYEMPRYSYQWPWLGLLMWSVMIGPVAGGAAYFFRKLLVMCQAFRPQGRFPITFDEAEVGRHVRLFCQEEGLKVRRKKLIRSKTLYHITVCNDDGSEKQELEEEEWTKADPKGRRDWTILVVMPAAFIFLALLSFDYPFLLGNGRALAQVAMEEGKPVGLLVTAFFLKAFATAAAIGSGAAGGTLTPSVALGATLAAITGQGFEYLHAHADFLPGAAGLVPLDVKAMVGAAAFLAAMMKAPVTSVVLLMEFSAQGLRSEDLAPLLRGDPMGFLVESKLAIGMWLPMAIAVTGATFTHKCLQPKKKRSWMKRMPTLTVRDYSAAKDLDVQGEFHEVRLNNLTKDACLKCFQTGLLANACLTVGVGAMMPESHDKVTAISAVGVPLAAVVAFAMYMQNMESSTIDDCPLLSVYSMHSLPRAMTKHSMSRGLAIVCAVCGASMPLFPWSLQMWRDTHSTLTALVASISCAVVASACGATIDVMHPHVGQIRNRFEKTGQRRAAVATHNFVTFLAIAASFFVGYLAHHRILRRV
mmetsp:Transcript_49626/g.89832  ORF Transcript_49626/g.89832 Transcript_49626/m.89832 type:complete len:737 (+) Transcript_49626:88-2298(+)